MTPESIPGWIWKTEVGAEEFAKDTKKVATLIDDVGRRVRQEVSNLREGGGYIATSAMSAQDTVDEIAELAGMISDEVDEIRRQVRQFKGEISDVVTDLKTKKQSYLDTEQQRSEHPGGIRHEFNTILQQLGGDISGLVEDAEEHDHQYSLAVGRAIDDLLGTVARLEAMGWRSADPPTLDDMTVELEELTSLELIADVGREGGLDVDEERIEESLDALLDAGLIDRGDLQNPVLLAYVANRPYGTLPITEEWEVSDISIDEDGSLKAFGMDDWDPAALAAIQDILDEDARERFGEYVTSGRETGQLPEIAPGHYTADMAAARRQALQDWRKQSAENLIEDWNEKGDRGFFSADLYDDLIEGYDAGSNGPADNALLLAITQSALHGPIPVYEMTGWDKFKDGVGKLATPVSVLSTVFIWTPGGWVAKGVTWTARGLTAIEITDACAVDRDGGRCMTTVALTGIGGVSQGKIKGIKEHMKRQGPLTAGEDRLLKGLETFYDLSEKGISVVVTDEFPEEFEPTEETEKYVEKNAPDDGGG
ncbi:MAG: hypothetical protein GEU79_10675 [Acidimicrobiia bacterium]|nr:hypothetical protein [Acidimicrobiia bacterium]